MSAPVGRAGAARSGIVTSPLSRTARVVRSPDMKPGRSPAATSESREEPMNVNDAFPSNYLKASDLQGKAVAVTISHVEREAIGRDKEMKPVLYFKGKTKGVVLNKTNARNITNLLGTAETDEWAGHVIAIYPTTTEFAGETVEGIRVKAARSEERRVGKG